jgi:hypothetical protein
MRNQEEIQRQIDGLLAEKESLPEVSGLGTPNHEIADIKISILKGDIELDDVEEGDWEEMDSTNEIYRGAEEAHDWLEGDREEDLFEED